MADKGFVAGFKKRTGLGGFVGSSIEGAGSFAKDLLADENNVKGGTKLGEKAVQVLFEAAVQSGAKWLESQAKTGNPILDKAMGTFVSQFKGWVNKSFEKHISEGGNVVRRRAYTRNFESETPRIVRALTQEHLSKNGPYQAATQAALEVGQRASLPGYSKGQGPLDVETLQKQWDSLSHTEQKALPDLEKALGEVSKIAQHVAQTMQGVTQHPEFKSIATTAGSTQSAVNALDPLARQAQSSNPMPPTQSRFEQFFDQITKSQFFSMAAYHTFNSGMNMLSSGVGSGQNSLITSGMLQNQLSPGQSTQGNYQNFNRSITNNVGQKYGYQDTDSLAAASGYLPFTRTRSTGDLSSIASMSDTYGQDYASFSSSMGDAARIGLVGQRPGDLSSYQSLLAGTFGKISNPSVQMGDYASGLQDFARVMSSNTMSTPSLTGANGKGLSTAMQLYQGLNQMGPLTSGTAGAALLAQANQGIVNGGNGSASTQMAYYQALGGPNGISPSQLQYVKEGGLTGDTFQKLMKFSKTNYGGFSKSDQLLATSNLFGVDMHQMEKLEQAAQQHGGMLSKKQIDSILHPSTPSAAATARSGQNTGDNFLNNLTKRFGPFLTGVQQFTGALGPIARDLAIMFGGPLALKGAGQLIRKIPTPRIPTGGAGRAADEGAQAGAAEGASAAARTAGGVGRVAGLLRNPIVRGAGRLAGAAGVGLTIAGATTYYGKLLSQGMDQDDAAVKTWLKQHPGWVQDSDTGDVHKKGYKANVLQSMLNLQDPKQYQHYFNVVGQEQSALKGGKAGGGSGHFIKNASTDHLSKLGDVYGRHLTAANKEQEDLVASVLNTHAPLLPRTKQQLTDTLTKFLSTYGKSLNDWFSSSLGQVPSPGSGGSGGDSGDPSVSGGYDGDTYGSNTFSGFSIAAAQYTDIGKTSALSDDVEAGNVYDAGVGTQVKLPEGARYNAKYSTKYNSMFTLPDGRTLSIMHIDAKRFKNNQQVKEGTVIGTVTTAAKGASGGTYGDTNSSGFQFTQSSDRGVFEADLYDNPQDAGKRTTTGQYNFSNWLSSLQKVHSGGSGSGGSGKSPYHDLPSGWEKKILKAIHAPDTAANEHFLDSWSLKERGRGSNVAAFNPFNTTQGESGATNFNSVGVKNYTSWNQGFGATVDTLNNGYYGDILSLLRGGVQAGQSYDLTGMHTWGTGALDPSQYSDKPSTSYRVGGGSGGFVGSGTQPAVNLTVQNLVVEVTMPDGTKVQATGKVKYNGVAGVHVQKNHPHLAHPSNKGHVRR